MAINTDAAFGKSALGEREVSNPTDFQDTEKLLSAAATATTTDPGGQSNVKPSDSFSLSIRGSVRSLDADQNGHRSPLKSGSIGQLAAPPKSSSRLSLGPLPSPLPPGPVPPTYFWLAVLSCFCPAVPLNMCALWYANVVSCVHLQPWLSSSSHGVGQSACAWCLGVLCSSRKLSLFQHHRCFASTVVPFKHLIVAHLLPLPFPISRGPFSTQEILKERGSMGVCLCCLAVWQCCWVWLSSSS